MVENLFTYLRSTQVLLLVLALFNVIAMIFLEKKLKFKSLTVINAFFTTLIASELLVKEGYIIDQLGLEGDKITLYIFLITLVIFVVGLVLFFLEKKRK